MIKKQYSAASKRALNIIWNAAGRYDFDPPFFAFYMNGRPDHYFNLVIGLLCRWLDMDAIAAFFDRLSAARDSDEYEEYFWLALENCLFEKELPMRPVLASLRAERAEEFFLVQQTLSVQQMEMMSVPVYNQQQARWASVTGRSLPLLSPKEKRLFAALQFSGDLDTAAVIRDFSAILKEYFRYDVAAEAEPQSRSKQGFFRKLYGRYKKQKVTGSDRLIVRSGTGTGDPFGAVHLNQENGIKKTPEKEQEDRLYMEACFGPSIYPEETLHRIESILCQTPDLGCHLWFSNGVTKKSRSETAAAQPSVDPLDSRSSSLSPKLQKEVRNVRSDIEKQSEKNRRYAETHALQLRESVKKLSGELEVILSSYLKHLPEKSQSGKIAPEKAYRMAVFHDTSVFLRDGDEAENTLAIDLLLDASQSRMNSQEIIASEAYIIAESLEKLHIPVEVHAFRSLRGTTVLECLKSAKTHSTDGIFRYFASGWNRDALAFRAMSHRIQERQQTDGAKRHILLILTDASPNDSTPLSDTGRNYEGLPPVACAQEAVKELKALGIHTAAVFHGSSSHLANVYQIYGKESVRIRSIAQLSSGVSDLIQMILREMEAD